MPECVGLGLDPCLATCLHRALRSQGAELHQQTFVTAFVAAVIVPLALVREPAPSLEDIASLDPGLCNYFVLVDVWMLLIQGP